MKKTLFIFLLTLSIVSLSKAQTTPDSLKPAFDVIGSLGLVKWHDNQGTSGIRPQFRAALQFNLLCSSNFLYGQLGLGYYGIKSSSVYFNGSSEGATTIDGRLVVVPYSTEGVKTMVYGGLGLTNDIFGSSSSKTIAIMPVGVGVQVPLTDKTMLDFGLGYNYLFGLGRTDPNLNSDGFFGFTAGVQFNRAVSSFSLCKSLPEGIKTVKPVDTVKVVKEIQKTNPKEMDSDGDGLNDFDEVNVYKTDYLKADTDSDGLKDGDEILKYKTNPLKADTDGDGLSDGDEVLKYTTDPLKADTDGDGLSDGDEVLKYMTNPFKTDTDGDGLSDGDEVLQYRTDPLKADTDGGTINDGEEVKRGTNPLDKKDDVIETTVVLEKGKKIILKGVNFDYNQATLTKDSEGILKDAYNAFLNAPGVLVNITGHTDSDGDAKANTELSLKRAQAVRDWLIKKGIAADRLKAFGKGSTEPIADNTSNDGKSKNRRVEFYVEQ